MLNRNVDFEFAKAKSPILTRNSLEKLPHQPHNRYDSLLKTVPASNRLVSTNPADTAADDVCWIWTLSVPSNYAPDPYSNHCETSGFCGDVAESPYFGTLHSLSDLHAI